MTHDVYSICLMGSERPIREIKELWPNHFHLTDRSVSTDLPEETAEVVIIAAGRTNGVLVVKEVYDLIHEKHGHHFTCFIVPVATTFFGYNRNQLWEWLNKVTGVR